ncbi:Choline transporter-like protein 1, partial [Stegodyphus mimosarum]
MGGCCCCPTSSRVSSVKGDARSFPDSSYSFEGPVKDRSCTDGIFLILLSVYLIFLLVGVGIAGVRGDPRRLIYGVDEYGNICGLKNQRISGANQSGVDYSGVKYLTVSQQCTDGTCRTKKQCEK